MGVYNTVTAKEEKLEVHFVSKIGKRLVHIVSSQTLCTVYASFEKAL